MKPTIFVQTDLRTVRSSGLEMAVSGLLANHNYTLFLAAETIAGIGPWSSGVTCVTREDSKY